MSYCHNLGHKHYIKLTYFVFPPEWNRQLYIGKGSVRKPRQKSRLVHKRGSISKTHNFGPFVTFFRATSDFFQSLFSNWSLDQNKIFIPVQRISIESVMGWDGLGVSICEWHGVRRSFYRVAPANMNQHLQISLSIIYSIYLTGNISVNCSNIAVNPCKYREQQPLTVLVDGGFGLLQSSCF